MNHCVNENLGLRGSVYRCPKKGTSPQAGQPQGIAPYNDRADLQEYDTTVIYKILAKLIQEVL